MPFAGNTLEVRNETSCHADYEDVKKTALYGGFQNSFTAPSAENYVARLLREAPDAKLDVRGKLAVVSGVVYNQVGHHIALQLAVQAEMHVLLMGKSERGLRNVVDAIQAAAERRGISRPQLYIHRLVIASLDSARTAADQCRRLAHSKYDGKLHVVVHHASVGAAEARLTADGLEYNTGCNFLTTHYLTKQYLPLLRNASTAEYKPRVVCTASMGHCLGYNLAPQRLIYFPKEGGAPAGYIVDVDDDRIREREPPQGGSYTTAEKLAAIPKAGTQVGRSKMALVADVIHWARLHPEISFTTHHTGAIAPRNNSSGSGMAGLSPLYQFKRFMSQFSPSQGARSALRAALDPDFNYSLSGAYLHCDGNPWVPAHSTTIDPDTKQPYTMEKLAEVCHSVAEQVIATKLSELASEDNRDTYEPPPIVATDEQSVPTESVAQAPDGGLDEDDDDDDQDDVGAALEILKEREALIQTRHPPKDEDEASWGTWIQKTTRK